MASLVPAERTIDRARLLEALRRGEQEGSWTRDQTAALLAELDRSPTAEPGPPAGAAAGGARARRWAEVAAYAGAILVAAAGALLAAQHWDALGRPGRAMVLAGVTGILAAAGVATVLVHPRGRQALRRPEAAVRRRLAGTVFTVAAATAAGTAAVLAPSHALLAAGATAVVAVVLGWWAAPTALGELAALAAVGLLAGGVLEEFRASPTALVLTFAGVGLGWAALSRTGLPTAPDLAAALGLAVAWYTATLAVFATEQPAEGVAVALLCLLVAGGIGGYARSGSRPLAAVGGLALAVLVLRFSSERLGPVLALLVTGLVLLAVAGVVLLRGRSGPR